MPRTIVRLATAAALLALATAGAIRHWHGRARAPYVPQDAALRGLPACVRIAIVRGERDRYRAADSALAAAGGDRLRRYVVRWASHSLTNVAHSGATVERALGDLLGPALAPAGNRDTMVN